VSVFVGAGLLASACEIDRGESSFPDQEIVDAGMADTGTSIDGGIGQGPGAGTMTGTWLLYHERSTCVLRQEQLTHATYVVELEQDGATVTETRRLCDTQLSEILGMQLEIPDVVLENIEFVSVDRGVVSTLRVGGTYVSATEVALWGLDLDEPTTEAIPSEPQDPRVVDSDGDGNPGVTFEVGSDCRRYQGQRQIIKYRGSFTAPNQIDGQSTGVTDVVALGGSKDFCAIAPPVESNDPHSRFRMVRVDGRGGSFDADTDGDGQVSCEEALAVAPLVMDDRESENANCQE
jgi:hypothetical protein